MLPDARLGGDGRECSGPPPPKAAQANRRGSSPRSRLMRRTRSAILASTTVEMPAAVSMQAEAEALRQPADRSRRAPVEPHPAAEVLVGVDQAEHHVGVGDRGSVPPRP